MWTGRVFFQRVDRCAFFAVLNKAWYNLRLALKILPIKEDNE